jgi:glycerol-3-phosphate dehydrogenase
VPPLDRDSKNATEPGVDEDALRHLESLYGSRAREVLAIAASAPALARRLSPRYPDIAAQVVFAVRFEHSVRLADFIRRRTLLGASTDQGWDAATPAAELMAGELGWSVVRVAEELDAYRRDIEKTEGFKGER